MNIVIYRVRAEELEQVLEKICLKLDIPYKYDKYRRLISIENGILHPIYIDGRTGPCDKLAGLRPDFYNIDDGRDEIIEWAFWILEQAACKVNGIKLNNVRSVLKIIDILKIPEEEK